MLFLFKNYFFHSWEKNFLKISFDRKKIYNINFPRKIIWKTVESQKGRKNEEIIIFASARFQQPGTYIYMKWTYRGAGRSVTIVFRQKRIFLPLWESLAPPISPHPDCGGRQLSQAGGEGVVNPRANLSTTLLIIKKKGNRRNIFPDKLQKFKTKSTG